ncbi:MAG: ABC transporter substrate-binding protein [Thermodesulfobacteriota bacterium]
MTMLRTGFMRPKPFFRSPFLLFLILTCSLLKTPITVRAAEEIRLPMDMSILRNELMLARAETDQKPPWPRKIIYDQVVLDPNRRAFRYSVQSVEVPEKPERIIPHTVNLAEILWAICPRERIAAFHSKTADPAISFIAEPIGDRFPLFSSETSAASIFSLQPDLVLTAYPSGPELNQIFDKTRIPCLDLGYIGSLQTIQKQIRLIGRAIGEMGNAEALIRIMNRNLRQILQKMPKPDPPPRVVLYAKDGFVTGRATPFDTVCRIIGAVNVAAEQKISFLKQVPPETILEWNPDLIVIPSEHARELHSRFRESPILSRTDAVRKERIYAVDGRYLNAGSQFILLSANLLAGIVYPGSFSPGDGARPLPGQR